MYTEQRLKGICKLFKKSYKEGRWDFILIQELWPVKERSETLKKCGFPYVINIDRKYNRIGGLFSWLSHFIYGDKVDAGLWVLSRFPLSAPKRHTFSENGFLWNVVRSIFESDINDLEYLANRSALLVTVYHPAGPLLVANIHLVSNYIHENYYKQRWLQLEQLSRFVKENSSKDHIAIIVGGDFNIGPLENGNESNELYRNPEYDWDDIMSNLFSNFYHATPLGQCTYCYSKNMFATSEGGVDERIDHILASHNLITQKTSVVDEKIWLEEKGIYIPLSDHFGVEVVFEYKGKKFLSEKQD